MKTIMIYGGSDDLFYLAGDKIEGGERLDEIDCYEKTGWAVIESPSSDKRVMVTGVYCGPGVWSMGIAPADEDVPIPDWPIHFTLADRGYSAVLSITVPDDARVAELEAALKPLANLADEIQNNVTNYISRSLIAKSDGYSFPVQWPLLFDARAALKGDDDAD